jgi:transposase InsO family protein
VPTPHVQFPHYSQGLNRYSYGLNNPLSYVDPSGYCLSKIFRAVKRLFQKVVDLIEREGPWRNLEQVEYRTFQWVGWYNQRRLMEPLGDIPPIEFEQAYHAQGNGQAIAA